MSPTAWGLLLVVATVATAAQQDLGEGAGIGDRDGASRAKTMRGVDVQGLKVLDHYMAFNKKLVTEERGLRHQLDSPPEKLKGLAYVAIPGYKYGYQGRTMEEKSRAECELVCSTYSACKSYSYNKQKRECIWSLSHIHYDTEFTMWAKLLTMDGHFHTHLYTELPGMLVQDKKNPATKDMSFEECQYECTKDEACKTFSFSTTKSECLQSSTPLHFSDGWTYFEKDIPLKNAKKSKHKKENDEKKKMKLAWLKASTSSSRQDMEKATEATEKLEHARVLAEDAERVGKAARREMTFNQKKCLMMSGSARNSMKRSMGMMSIVSRRQMRTIKLQATAESMSKSVKQQTRKEALSKAKMNAKLAEESRDEGAQKLAEIKKVESDEKMITKHATERKVKACEKDEESQVFFTKRENHVKSTEAEAKRLQNKKDVANANLEYKKAAQIQDVKGQAERAAKKLVEVQRTLVESAAKREQKSERERDRKVAMDEKERYQTSFEHAQSKEKDLQRRNMVAKEKLAKTKANRDDLKKIADVAKKAKMVRDKEYVQKSDERKKQKLADIAKQKETEEQTQKQAQEEHELSKKRVVKQEAGVTGVMDTLKQDEMTLQADSSKRQQDTNSINADRKQGEQADKQREEGLLAVTAKEKETKTKVAEEHARTQNLLQELKNTEKQANEAAGRERAAAAEADRAKKEQTAIAKEERATDDPGKQAALAAKEAYMKKKEISSSVAADEAAEQKATTALQQQTKADDLKAQSCVAVCIEGTRANHKAAELQKEEQMNQLASKMQFGSDTESPVELGDDTFSGPMSLIEIGEDESLCEPVGISASSGGACGQSVTDQILSDACGSASGRCGGICKQRAEMIQTSEASCKTHMKNPVEAQIETAPMPSEDSPAVSDAARKLYEDAEKGTKETKVKTDQAKPVPIHIHVPKHVPFTYKGCAC